MAIARQPEESHLDRAFEAHRDAVLAVLNMKFRDVPDHEDLYQQAWVEALEKIGKGAEVRDLRALLKLIAVRRARDYTRNKSAVPVDPNSPVMAVQADRRRLPDDVAEAMITSAIVRTVIDELSPRQAAAIKMRFELGLEGLGLQQRLHGVQRLVVGLDDDDVRRGLSAGSREDQ